MSADDAALRRARVSLSDLYLDTDVRWQLPLKACDLLDDRIDDVALVRLWREEVTPAVYWNLHSVAGERAGFDADWLEQRAAAARGSVFVRLGRGSRLLGATLHRLRAFGTEGHFRALLAFREALLPRTADARRATAKVWSALGEVYFDERTPLTARGMVAESRMTAARVRREWTETCARIYRRLVETGDAPHSVASARVEAWIATLPGAM